MSFIDVNESDHSFHEHTPKHSHHKNKDQHQEKEKHNDKFDDECVCKIVKKIHKAQESVEQDECRVSCEKSIQQLLSPSKAKPNADTIPFSLDCGCETFFGKGPVYDRYGNFCIISSPFFKVKKIKHNCCAILELLWPTCDGKVFKGRLDEDALHCFNFNGFVGTGACINVDLTCFCSISCHRPTMVDHASECQLHDICKCNKHSKYK